MQYSRCDVIITYCWNRVGYNILRSLSTHGLSVWVADTSRRNICSKSSFCAGSFSYPDPFKKERAFIDCLKEKVSVLKPKMLLPTHDESQIIMNYRDEFPDDLIIPYMDSVSLRNCSDKAWATEKARECGVPTPVVYASIDDVDAFPCVFKTVIGNSAKTVFFPKDKEELRALSEKFKDVKTLIEERIEGTDYSVDCIRWDGFFKASTYHALVTKTDGGGTTTQREIVSFPVMEKYSKMLLDHIGFSGVCGMDFRFNPDSGQIAFMEINARFTGGLATPIAAGFDIPWVLYSLATTGHYDGEINLLNGTKTKWILGDIIALVGRFCSFNFSSPEWRQAFRFKGFDAYDDYRKDDKCAIWGEMTYYFNKLIKKGRLNP